MRAFALARADSPAAAVQAARAQPVEAQTPQTLSPVQFLAGGTTLLDLMKLDVMRPVTVVDINPLRSKKDGVTATADGLRLDAFTSMAAVADHPAVIRDYPVVAQTLQLAASAQLRNMATLGGNMLQRTRCSYFRDARTQACNKRVPGSGCAALEGVNRQHAVLGTSDQCIAAYAGDFAQALIALDAVLETVGAQGARRMPFAELHRPPGNTPHIETVLAPGELITAIVVPAGPWTRLSRYVKVRDRESYQFALASAAVALDLQQNVVHAARIALGGVATLPWRAREAEALLAGKRLDQDTAAAAAQAAFASAQPRDHVKVALGQRTLARALLETARMAA